MSSGVLSAVTSMIGVELLRVVLIAYLWRVERAAHLRWWAFAVMAQSAAQVAVMPSLVAGVWPWLQPVTLILDVVGVMLLMRGTEVLLGKPWSRWWAVAGAVALVVGLGLGAAGAPLPVVAALPCAVLAAGYLTMAYALGWARGRPAGMGARVIALALLASGIHFADFPLLVGLTWFVPWGIGIALINEVAVTVGMVLVHFDGARAARDADAQRHTELTDAIGIATYEASATGRFTEVNGAMVRLLGYDRADALLAIDPSVEVYADEATRARMATTGEHDVLRGVDVAWRRRDGQVLTVQLFARTLRAADGRVIGQRGFAVDRTESLRMERALGQSQKLDAVGRLAGGVAHDFNNLLTIVKTNHAFVARAPLGPQARDALADAERAVKQASQLVRQLLDLGRKPGASSDQVEVGAVVRRTADLLQPSLGGRHQLVVVGAEVSHYVRLDARGLERVMVNLVFNARDAMADGGTITVTIRGAARAEHEGVELEVVDTGAGIASADLPHLFEPFFTTKHEGHGAGLGLSTVHGLVQHAGGAVEVDSAPGRGSRFVVWFPTVPRSEPKLTPVAKATAPLRVLVADDEAPIRRTVIRMMSQSGFDVVEASSGGEVVARHQGGERYDVVVTDARMPGVDGAAAARVVRDLAPETRIVLMSGYVDDLDKIDASLVDGFVVKPFDREQLLAAIRSGAAR